MSKKKEKDRKPRPLARQNQQIPNSQVRKFSAVTLNPDLEHARQYPICGCWIMSGWRDEGITPVVVARQKEDGRILFGVYLVDLYCLGVKDAFTRTDYSSSRFERELPNLCAKAPEPCSVELAHEVIYGALEYAERLGFEPHPDFKKQMADLILDPPDAHRRVDHVPFGQDGQPYYIVGPNDDERKTRFVIDALTRTCGEGNFHYLIRLGDMPD